MISPFDDTGRELDALFSVAPHSNGFDLIIESRGGSDHGPNPARNSNYAPALELHLSRMGILGMVLQELLVASSVAMQLPEEQRGVSLDNYSMPLALSSVSDMKALRLSIGRASAAFGRTDGHHGGNRTKRMLLRVGWPPSAGLPAQTIEQLLAHPPSFAVEEQPTDQPDLLEERVQKATTQFRINAKLGKVSVPAGQKKPPKSAGSSSRFVRDPNVIAWVLHEAAGHCEICTLAAPFQRADGEPFLEVHHVRPLGEGGPDTTDNAAACCPNCHRRLHHDPSRESLRLDIISRIGRLQDYPPANAED